MEFTLALEFTFSSQQKYAILDKKRIAVFANSHSLFSETFIFDRCMFQPNTYRADVASFGTFAVYTVLFVSVVTVVVIFENVVSLSAFLRYGKCCSLIKIFIGYRCFCLRINKFQILS